MWQIRWVRLFLITGLLLSSGQVLLIGGSETVELFEPKSETFQKSENGIRATRLFSAVALLRDESILLMGGYGTDVSATSQAWLIVIESASVN